MWRWAVLWPAAVLGLASATLDLRFYTQRRQYTPAPQVNCFEYTFPTDRFGRAFENGIRPVKAVRSEFTTAASPTFGDPLLNINEIARRFDRLVPAGTDIVKEHAKLVQDINGLRQAVFVAPFVDEVRDYDDSVLHEIIETTSTTTARPTTTRAVKASKGGFPVLLVGGSTQRQVVKSPPLKFPKPTISLVGTSASPLAKHPYPFVQQTTGRKPIKLCMSAITTMYTTTRRPPLWQRLLNALIPR